MKLSLTEQFKTVLGVPMTETYEKNGTPVTEPITLEVVLRSILTTPMESDTRKDKELEFKIISKLITSKDKKIEVVSEEISHIKDKAYKMYDSWLAGCIDLLLEGKKLPV